jgi:hypothetical protein
MLIIPLNLDRSLKGSIGRGQLLASGCAPATVPLAADIARRPIMTPSGRPLF